MWIDPRSFKGYVTVADFSLDSDGEGVFTPVGDLIVGEGDYDFIGSKVGISGDGNRILWGSYYWGPGGKEKVGRARVYDYALPTINLPPDATVECGSDTSPTSTGTPAFTDFCAGLTFASYDSTQTNACGEVITRTWTASDDCGNTETGDQIITVDDTTPPTISVPPDLTVECGEDVSTEATGYASGTDLCGENIHVDFIDQPGGCCYSQTIVRTWTATDDCGLTSSDAQVITVDITDDDMPPGVTCFDTVFTPTDTEFSILGSVSDNCDPDPTLIQSITSVSETGVYLDHVHLSATDAAGNEGSCTLSVLVVYFLSGGFVTGGGWFNSPAGAYVDGPSLEGKAKFGFVSKYKKGQSTPSGQTEFIFKEADLNFHSTSYEWLVVTGQPCAKFKGTGNINQSEGYSFMVTACDKSPDTIRVKIWETSDESLVYDNKKDSPDDSDDGTVLGGGQVTIHEGGRLRA